jgi:hypothetical protein
VHCQSFINAFVLLGFSEKGKIRKEQLQQQRETEKQKKIDNDKKVIDLSNTEHYTSKDLEFDENDEKKALEKLTISATHYDATHPAAFGLEGFQRSVMSIGYFYYLLY